MVADDGIAMTMTHGETMTRNEITMIHWWEDSSTKGDQFDGVATTQLTARLDVYIEIKPSSGRWIYTAMEYKS